MDELRLVGVHDDGEHLVLQDASGTRHVLRIDQQLRGTVQRARRVAPRRQGNQSGDFGPRDIQARFRAGATVEEIVEESGWEPERVRRYEWPILAERAHIAREAQKVEVVARTSRSGGYRSVFDGEAQSLAEIVAAHAGDLGIAPTSLDWDAWQRPDQQWQITARFRVANPGAAPQDLVDQQPAALWIFNPASLTVTPDNGWAGHLTAAPDANGVVAGSDSLFGAPSSTGAASAPASAGGDTARGHRHPSAAASGVDERSRPADHSSGSPAGSPAAQAGSHAQSAPHTEDSAGASTGQAGQETDELLDVLDARRGQRLGQDSDSDDQLAAILGRSMGHVDRRPRPISAPKDSPLFDQPMHPSRPVSQQPAPAQAENGHGEQAGTPDAGEPGTPVPSGGIAGADPSPAGQDRSEEATVHHLGRADAQDKPTSPVIEIMDDDSRPLDGDAAEPAQQEDGSSAPHPEEAAPGSTAAAMPPPGNGEAGVAPLRDAGSAGPSTPESRPDSDPADSDPAVSDPDSGRVPESTTMDDTAAEAAEPEGAEEAPEPEQPSRPRPRGRTNAKRSRSSVPSWDEIVFGAKNTDT